MSETWLPVPGHDGYEVSDLGRVQSWRIPFIGGRASEPRLMSTNVRSPKGYRQVRLVRDEDGSLRQWRVSVLVAHVFIGPRPEGMFVAHGNGDSTDDRLSNLRYATPQENSDDARTHGTSNAKLSEADVVAIRDEYATKRTRQVDLAARYGVDVALINRVIRGNRHARYAGPRTETYST